MAVTLLGGLARGFALEVPDGDHIRPTSVMLRRKIFDAHQDMENLTFIDLCAGSGAVGLEAWSRGASDVYLIEPDQKTYRRLVQNVKNISARFSAEARERRIATFPTKAEIWFAQFRQQYLSWDRAKQQSTIIFLDPPYEKKLIYERLASLELRQWFGGRMWIESDRQKGLAANHWELWQKQFVKTYTQGTSYVAVLDLREALG